ncbi:hypothetical protein NUSPORA_00463 [Nucleospora cyclopteri]
MFTYLVCILTSSADLNQILQSYLKCKTEKKVNIFNNFNNELISLGNMFFENVDQLELTSINENKPGSFTRKNFTSDINLLSETSIVIVNDFINTLFSNIRSNHTFYNQNSNNFLANLFLEESGFPAYSLMNFISYCFSENSMLTDNASLENSRILFIQKYNSHPQIILNMFDMLDINNADQYFTYYFFFFIKTKDGLEYTTHLMNLTFTNNIIILEKILAINDKFKAAIKDQNKNHHNSKNPKQTVSFLKKQSIFNDFLSMLLVIFIIILMIILILFIYKIYNSRVTKIFKKSAFYRI